MTSCQAQILVMARMNAITVSATLEATGRTLNIFPRNVTEVITKRRQERVELRGANLTGTPQLPPCFILYRKPRHGEARVHTVMLNRLKR